MSSKAYDTAAMMRSISSTVRTVWNGGLLSFDFFRDEGFVREPFLFLDVSASERGSLGCVTSPYFYLSSPPSSSSLSTFSPPPPSCESSVVSFDVLLNFCNSSLFLFLLLIREPMKYFY